jgi:exopolysaccharide production protein ExoQ
MLLQRRTAAASLEVVFASASLLMGSKLFLGLEQAWPPMAPLRDGAFIICYLYALGWLWFNVRRPLPDWLLREVPLLLAISTAIIASAAWSFDPKLTLSTALLFVGTTATGIFIGFCFEPPRIIMILLATYLLLLVVSVVAILTCPYEIVISHGPRFDAWMGLQGDKNQLGATAALAVLIFATALFRGRLRVLPGILLCLFALGVLLMCRSATPLVCTALGLTVLLAFLVGTRARLPSLITYMLVVCALLCATWFALTHLIAFTDIVGRDESFTGRTDIWKDAIGMLHYSPWLGFGYGAVWLASDQSWLPEFVTTTQFHDAHSGYLSLATQVGLPVMVLAIVQLGVLSCRSIGYLVQRKTTFAFFAVSYVLWFACYNLTETALYRWNSDEWMILVVVMTVTMRRQARSDEPVRARIEGASMPGRLAARGPSPGRSR